MEKIPTMYPRDESIKGHPVIPPVKPECAWVEAGEGLATEKLDGMNVKVERGQLFKRQKPKDRDYDNASYVPCDRSNPADKWLYAAFARTTYDDGIYEAVGPKIQGNPHRVIEPGLVKVLPVALSLVIENITRTYEGVRHYLAEHDKEGIVFHHPDGRLAKIKRRDFGLPWPIPQGTA